MSSTNTDRWLPEADGHGPMPARAGSTVADGLFRDHLTAEVAVPWFPIPTLLGLAATFGLVFLMAGIDIGAGVGNLGPAAVATFSAGMAASLCIPMMDWPTYGGRLGVFRALLQTPFVPETTSHMIRGTKVVLVGRWQTWQKKSILERIARDMSDGFKPDPGCSLCSRLYGGRGEFFVCWNKRPWNMR